MRCENKIPVFDGTHTHTREIFNGFGSRDDMLAVCWIWGKRTRTTDRDIDRKSEIVDNFLLLLLLLYPPLWLLSHVPAACIAAIVTREQLPKGSKLSSRHKARNISTMRGCICVCVYVICQIIPIENEFRLLHWFGFSILFDFIVPLCISSWELRTECRM